MKKRISCSSIEEMARTMRKYSYIKFSKQRKLGRLFFKGHEVEISVPMIIARLMGYV